MNIPAWSSSSAEGHYITEGQCPAAPRRVRFGCEEDPSAASVPDGPTWGRQSPGEAAGSAVRWGWGAGAGEGGSELHR